MALIVIWIENSLFIQFAILAFAAPFWVWYQVRLPAHERGMQRSLGDHIEGFFSSTPMNALVFCWAAAEAIVWFVIPEFLLLLIIFMRIRQRPLLLVWDFAGTIVGTILAYWISAPGGVVAHMPYITLGMVLQVSEWYQQFGVWGLAFQPLSGVPYKVFTNLARGNGVNLPALILVGTLVRMARYVLIYVVLSGLYPLFHRLIFHRYVLVFVGSCMVFTLLLLRIVHGYGNGYAVQDYHSIVVAFSHSL